MCCGAAAPAGRHDGCDENEAARRDSSVSRELDAPYCAGAAVVLGDVMSLAGSGGGVARPVGEYESKVPVGPRIHGKADEGPPCGRNIQQLQSSS